MAFPEFDNMTAGEKHDISFGFGNRLVVSEVHTPNKTKKGYFDRFTSTNLVIRLLTRNFFIQDNFPEEQKPKT